MKAPRAASLSGRVRAAFYEAILEEARSIAGRDSRALLATGSAEWMAVVAATGGSEPLAETGLEIRSLSPALRESLLGGSPAETAELDEALVRGEGFGRAFVCPVVIGGRLRGLLAVGETAALAPEAREALASLCDELALLPESTALATETPRRADYERLRALVEDVSEIITVMEADGSVRYVSPNVERVLGYRPEEYTGRNAFAYVHPSDAEYVSKSFFEGLESPSGTGHSAEFRVLHADGSWRLMQITARDLLDDPAVGGVVVTSRDVSGDRRRERELRESEERLQTVFRQATEGIFLVDMETRCILESNAACQELLGYTDAELRGMTLYDLVAHDRESIDANLRRVADGIHHIGERRYRRKDGSLVDVAASVSLVSFQERLVVSAIVRDISERKRAEAALRESEERFRALVEQAADALFVHDTSGRLLDVNRRACESLGYTKDELLALSVQDIEQNLEPGGLEELWKRVAAEGSAKLDGVHRRKDGTRFPVELHIGLMEVGGERLMLAAARDVTERRRMEEALRASEASLARAQQVARLGSWEAEMPREGTPPGESPMLWSDEMYRIFGYEPQSFELSYRTFLRLVHPEDRGSIKRKIRRAVYDRSDSIEYRLIRPGGEERYVQGRYELRYDRDEKSVYMVGALQDVTERKALERQLGYQAFHDSLTGLPNRSLFQNRLEQALTKRHRGELALLFVDLDNFKDVNDTLGHEVGDEVLARVGERLLESLSPRDTVARFGGDEFIVLLEGIEELDAARDAAERITTSLRAPFDAAGQEILLTTSIGIVQSGPGRESPGELLRDADVALYLAKEEGRAGYEVFDEAMSLKARERLSLMAELHRAIEEEQFVLYYQPKVDLATGKTAGVEALLRWEHPVKGRVSPSEFVPVAEETGLIRPIGGWVLREACRQLKEWQEQRLCEPALTVSVNLSARQFRHPNLAGEVGEVLEETGLAPECLVLEVTESMVMWDIDHTAATLKRLKDLGIQLSIDDFGTGYSNLAYLTRFPMDELKIDKSFVERLGEDAKDTAIVRAVIDLAAALGLRVIAEGVETAGQVDRLRELGCEKVQGYYFVKPLPAPAIQELLSPPCSE